MGIRTAALLIVFAVTGCAAPHKSQTVAAPPPPVDLNALYEQAIYQSAVKKPSYEVDLTPIDKTKPNAVVVSFYRANWPPFDPKSHRLRKPTWVSVPPELSQRCVLRGGDPVLALEEILGIPPAAADAEHGDFQIASFTVPTRRIFRPCASGPDISTPRCSRTIEKANGSQADFVYRQMWNSYQESDQGQGYPFTGMGWTYDWGPDAMTHVGVSEYVVREGTMIANLKTMTPAEFCAAGATPPPAPAVTAPTKLSPAAPPSGHP